MINHRLHRFSRFFGIPTKSGKKQITQIALLVTGYWLLVTSSYAQSISSIDLINNAKEYDGKIVTYTGEVIGDIMVRGKYAWINVNDGKAAIGIWIDEDLIKDITYAGNYKSKGDWIEIMGIFQRACSQHGGDLDIHAQKIIKISSGAKTTEKLNLGKRNLVFVLLGVLFLIWILRQLKIR